MNSPIYITNTNSQLSNEAKKQNKITEMYNAVQNRIQPYQDGHSTF